jgi:hypothetical protein
MGIEDMARFALSIAWAGVLLGGLGLALFLWLMVVASSENVLTHDGATIAAFFVTLVVAGCFLWTLSAADIFHVWTWVFERRGR